MVDFEQKYKVNGKMMTRLEIFYASNENPNFSNEWKEDREKLRYRYGHNYEHLSPERQERAMLHVYSMSGLPLSDSERRLVEEDRRKQKIEYQEYLEKKGRRSRKKKVL